jgi:hypothetical protein
MTHLPELWSIIKAMLTQTSWTSLDQIYRRVERTARLDNEDYEPQSPSSEIPKWKRNVRNVLQYRKRTGEIRWDGDANYKLS